MGKRKSKKRKKAGQNKRDYQFKPNSEMFIFDLFRQEYTGDHKEEVLDYCKNAVRYVVDQTAFIEFCKDHPTFQNDDIPIPFPRAFFETQKQGADIGDGINLYGIGYCQYVDKVAYVFSEKGELVIGIAPTGALYQQRPSVMTALACFLAFIKPEYSVCQSSGKPKKSPKHLTQSPYSTDIVRVYRKRSKSEVSEPSETLPLNRDHRWRVQGFWREIKGIGHGPEGEIVPGKTWVKSHVRGPIDLPLKEKIRIVK
jgi:hypothetical protein